MAFFAVRAVNLRQPPMRQVVVFGDDGFDVLLEAVPRRNRRVDDAALQPDFAARPVKHNLPRFRIHILADIGRQAFGGAGEDVVAAFGRALGL